MSELAETIERVVREVLASRGYTVAAVPHEPDGSLVLDRRVVTLADLPERLKDLRRVIVPEGAVVTPAVREELQKRQIELVVGRPAGLAAKPANAILMVAAATYDPASLAGALQRDGFSVELRHMDCLVRATDQLAADLRGGSPLGLLATAYPAAAVCLANRQAGVRAILGTRPDQVVGDAESVGANLLVFDPTALGFFAIKQMASRFLRGGPRQCPEVFAKRLG